MGPSLLDAIIIGLLSRQPDCALQVIDISGFEEGKLCLTFEKNHGTVHVEEIAR